MVFVSARTQSDLVVMGFEQGCQIFIGPKYQNGTKLPQNTPTGHEIFPMAVKYTKWS
jgi:hypothetical protein